MPAGEPLRIKGLKELRRGLRKAAGGNVNAAVKKGHREVSDFIIPKTKGAAAGRASSRGPASSNRGARRLARSFKSAPTVRAARIRSSLPDAYGQEFGSKRFRRFPSYTGFSEGQVGRKAIDDNEPAIGDLYIEETMKAFREAYPDRV